MVSSCTDISTETAGLFEEVVTVVVFGLFRRIFFASDLLLVAGLVLGALGLAAAVGALGLAAALGVSLGALDPAAGFAGFVSLFGLESLVLFAVLPTLTPALADLRVMVGASLFGAGVAWGAATPDLRVMVGASLLGAGVDVGIGASALRVMVSGSGALVVAAGGGGDFSGEAAGIGAAFVAGSGGGCFRGFSRRALSMSSFILKKKAPIMSNKASNSRYPFIFAP